jgi:hypothetical protein
MMSKRVTSKVNAIGRKQYAAHLKMVEKDLIKRVEKEALKEAAKKKAQEKVINEPIVKPIIESLKIRQPTTAEKAKMRLDVKEAIAAAREKETQEAIERMNKKRLANKIKARASTKAWIAKNKEAYYARARERIICECGIDSARGVIASHRKSRRHAILMLKKNQQSDDELSRLRAEVKHLRSETKCVELKKELVNLKKKKSNKI